MGRPKKTFTPEQIATWDRLKVRQRELQEDRLAASNEPVQQETDIQLRERIYIERTQLKLMDGMLHTHAVEREFQRKLARVQQLELRLAQMMAQRGAADTKAITDAGVKAVVFQNCVGN